MTENRSCLPGLAEAVCVDLSRSTETVLPTEFELSELLVGEWFSQQTGFKLPNLADKLGIDEERMLVAADPEKHLMVFRSSDGLKQALIKYGASYKNNKKRGFPIVLGLSGLDEDGRLTATAWKLINSNEDRENQVWRTAGGVVSYKEEIKNEDFIDSSTRLADAEEKMFSLPWFTQAMLAKVSHSRVLEIRDGSVDTRNMSLGNSAVCRQLGFSIVNIGANSYMVWSKRPKDPWQFAIQKRLEHF